ncbi:hypothetical protein Hypma_011120 [Hypsizygus marmoreus]|uniref:Uncharacterized protein n=1 Tax=Hypsizygus marmoreus TaxID=39966 RepID=A0A369JKW3_HYPMA|nr:hypothetical protein Hypma_011120 [Hypsizygus marmoreus]
MFRRHIPDLDNLESPLISASPFGSILGAVPGSAIAEKIFNDPESWQDAAADEVDAEETKEAMAWLAEEVEKYHASGDELGLSPIERDMDVALRPFSERYRLKPTLTLPLASEQHAQWESVMENEKPPYLPIFERSGLDLTLDLNLRLSKIWESGGKIFRSFPSPLKRTPALSVSKGPTSVTKPDASSAPSIRLAVPPTLDLTLSSDKAPSPIVSPAPVASASTTWSILEWYGVHPETPRIAPQRTSLLSPYPPTTFGPVPPVPHLPASLRTPPSRISPVVTLPTLPKLPVKSTPPPPEPMPIRRLPVIPDSTRNTPSLTPATPPRIMTPERTPRNAATLPPPSSSASESSISSLSPPPPSRAGMMARSPPAGPRPRSSTTPVKQRQCGGPRESPSPFTISPAPGRIRRSPSPLPLPPPPQLRFRAGVRV